METLIHDRLERAIADRVFPGAVVGVTDREGRRLVVAAGRQTYESGSSTVTADTIYDTASLTKAVAGASVLLKLVETGELGFDDPVVRFIPSFDTAPEKRAVTVRHLLSYTVNLVVPSMSSLRDEPPETIVNTILAAPLREPPGLSFRYTNSTALLLSLVVEAQSGRGVEDYAAQEFFTPLGLNRSGFRPDRRLWPEIAPTEIDPWRGREIRGEVHDESTWVLQQKYQVCIAGLFATVPDLLTFQEMLLREGELNGRRYFLPETVAAMYENQYSTGAGLGWDIAQPYMGRRVSPQAFGKTGFTGGVMVQDPKQGRAFTLLTNRTYPHRPVSNEALNAVRREIADIVCSGSPTASDVLH